MNFSIPPQLNEAGNGAILVMAFFFVVFMSLYLGRAWFKSGRNWQTFRTYENKAAFGMLTMFIGFMLKGWSEWWFLHLKSHGTTSDYPLLVPAFVIGTGMALWGMICLMRALSRYSWGPLRWVWLALIALAFGIWFAS